MSNNQDPSAFGDSTPWSDLYRQAAEEQNDFVSEVRSAVDYGMTDPEDSVQIACAAAETADASVQALSHAWSLYTPQDAATVASALFVQLQKNADALQELRRAMGRIVQRGEAELPAPAGPGQPANLADALDALLTVSSEIHGLVDRHASTTVHALHVAPGSAPVPSDAHQTVVAVAALLAEQHDGAVTLKEWHADGTYDPEGDRGLGCGCEVLIVNNGEEYSFHRGDSQWSILRLSSGRPDGHGNTVFREWETTSTSLTTAHPQQLVHDILPVVAAQHV
ncbi:hypothetical protein ACWEKM_24625 [Streptomyces sp. NPDC004752]